MAREMDGWMDGGGEHEFGWIKFIVWRVLGQMGKEKASGEEQKKQSNMYM